MNWYKQAQQNKNRLSELLKSFSMTAFLGLLGILGLNTYQELQNKYNQNPQIIEQKITEYKINNLDDVSSNEISNINDYQTPSSNLNLEEIRKMIEKHEGKENTRYFDSKGIPTVGIGFNLNRPDAKNKIESLGANYENVKNGRESLNDKQIYILFNENLKEAVITAQSFLPNFYEHPSNVQSVLINMAFNLGPNKLFQFKKFQKALINKDYQTAADEMIDSKWYNQVGNRSKELVSIMKGI